MSIETQIISEDIERDLVTVGIQVKIAEKGSTDLIQLIKEREAAKEQLKTQIAEKDKEIFELQVKWYDAAEKAKALEETQNVRCFCY